MPRGLVGSPFMLLLAVTAAIMLGAIADRAEAGMQVSPEELRDELSEPLPNSILWEEIGSIEIIDREEEWLVVWMAMNLAEFEDHPGSAVGNLFYFTYIDKDTLKRRTVLLPISLSTIKRDLRVVGSLAGDGYRLLWLEEYELWTCLWTDGFVHNIHRVLDIEVWKFDLVQNGDRTELYCLSEDMRSVYWCAVANATVEGERILHLDYRWDIHRICCYREEDMNVVLVSMEHQSSQVEFKALLMRSATLVDEITIDSVRSTSWDPHVVLVNGSNLILRHYRGSICIDEVDIQNRTTTFIALVRLEGLRSVWDIDVLAEGARVSVFVNGYPYNSSLGRRVFMYDMDASTWNATGPEVLNPLKYTSVEDDYAVIREDGKLYVVVEHRYDHGDFHYQYGRLMFFERDEGTFVPHYIINPRNGPSSGAYSIATASTVDGYNWLAASVDANGSAELWLYQVIDPLRGEMVLRATTPWYWSLSFMDPRLLDRNGQLVIVCKTSVTSRPTAHTCPLVVFTFDPGDDGFEEPLMVPHEPVQVYDVELDALYDPVFAIRESGGIDLFRFHFHNESLVHLGNLTKTDKSYQLFSMDLMRGRMFITATSSRNLVRSGSVIELDLSNNNATVVNEILLFEGVEDNLVYIDTCIAGEDRLVITRRMRHRDKLINSFDRFTVNVTTGEMEGSADIQVPDKYYVLDTAMVSRGEDQVVLTFWGYDIDRLVKEGRRVYDLCALTVSLSQGGEDSSVELISVNGVPASFPPPEVTPPIIAGAGDITMGFTFYDLPTQTSHLYLTSHHLLEGGLRPRYPLDGALLNTTEVTFGWTPVVSEWINTTRYQLRVWDVVHGGRMVYSSPWSVSVERTVPVSDGKYEWTVAYTLLGAVQEEEWRWGFSVDATPPLADAGGPYLDATVGVSLLLEATGSWDNVGITLYRWTLLLDEPMVLETDRDTLEIEPAWLGTVVVRLEVLDAAGNIGTAPTLIVTRPPTPVLIVEMVTPIEENSEATFSCDIPNRHDGITYRLLWTIEGGTKTGSSVEHVFMDDGIYIIGLSAIDDMGRITNWSGSITVLNGPPTVSVIPDVSVVEFTPFTMMVHATDTPMDELEYVWSLDGDVVDRGRQINLSLNDGTYEVNLVVMDDDGGRAERNATVEVTPSISTIRVAASVDKEAGELVINWFHGIEPDFVRIDVLVTSMASGQGTLWSQSVLEAGDGELVRELEGLPDVFYVVAVLHDDGLESWSDVVEVNITEPPGEEPSVTFWSTGLFWLLLIVAIVSSASTVLVLYRERERPGV